jgi:hypothetical protein
MVIDWALDDRIISVGRTIQALAQFCDVFTKNDFSLLKNLFLIERSRHVFS